MSIRRTPTRRFQLRWGDSYWVVDTSVDPERVVVATDSRTYALTEADRLNSQSKA